METGKYQVDKKDANGDANQQLQRSLQGVIDPSINSGNTFSGASCASIAQNRRAIKKTGTTIVLSRSLFIRTLRFECCYSDVAVSLDGRMLSIAAATSHPSRSHPTAVGGGGGVTRCKRYRAGALGDCKANHCRLDGVPQDFLHCHNMRANASQLGFFAVACPVAV